VDTIVRTRITAVDRPWAYTGNAPRPPEGMEYLTVDVQIDVHGPTQVIVALPDFWLTTFDGRSWSPVPGRGAELQPGAVPNDVSVHDWLTFMIPRNQPAVQLSWRLRTSQTLASQGDIDQTLAMPLTVGATATAGIGKQAPPADAPVVGPSTAAPTSSGSSNSSGSGGSSTVSGTRLQ